MNKKEFMAVDAHLPFKGCHSPQFHTALSLKDQPTSKLEQTGSKDIWFKDSTLDILQVVCVSKEEKQLSC